jgi:hypothetical protein
LIATYVDIQPSGKGWLIPSEFIRKEEAEEKLGAADLAYSLLRIRLAEQKEGTELAQAKARLGNLLRLPEPHWDEWSWEPKEQDAGL